MKNLQLKWAWPLHPIPLFSSFTPKVIDFFNALTFLQKACLVCGTAPLPVYLIEAQWLYLLQAIRELFAGKTIAFLPFTGVLAETILIMYGITLVIGYWRSVAPSGEKAYSGTFPQSNPCLVIRYIPRHLLDERPDQTDEPLFNERVSELNLEDQAFLDHLPQAMEILKSNSAMLDLYHRHQPEPAPETTEPQRPKTLLELLRETQHPDITSTSELIEYANA